MKSYKWIALVAISGTLLQFGTCAQDLVYYMLQSMATQLINGLVTTVTA